MYVFRVFGVPVFSFGYEAPPVYDCEDEVGPQHIEGGSAHNFERDFTPLSTDDRYEPWEDRHRAFGFGVST
jgi:hypothetical protein